MKKIFFTGFLLVLAGLFLKGTPANASQSPHWSENDISCLDCHITHQGPKTPCIDCHNNTSGSSYSKFSAPAVDSHVGLSCETCHDPHTSAQCTVPLVTGTFSEYQLNAQTTTFTIDSSNIVDTAWNDPATWSEKSGTERGLIFTVTLGLWDTSGSTPEYVDYSAEVVSADATSITVNGIHAGIDLTGSLDFSLIYGQLIGTTINSNAVIFSGPTTFASNDGSGPGGNDSTPDGVCQVCHTQTSYWRNDGSLAIHNDGQDCTGCHEHKSGFAAGCNNCHGNPPVVNGDLVFIPSATGSTTAGGHQLHATASGFDAECNACHDGGMPTSPISGNNRIQIGFGENPEGVLSEYDGHVSLQTPYSYEGVNNTTVTTGGSLTCSNVYCHSNGGWVSNGRMNDNATPPWNYDRVISGPLSCDSCHPFPMTTGPEDPRKDTHSFHTTKGYSDCGLCHYDNVTNHYLHSNGVYDVRPSPTFPGRPADGDQPLTFTYTFAEGGGTCSSNSCHAYWTVSDPMRWGINSNIKIIPYLSGLQSTDIDRVIVFDATRSACYEVVDGVPEDRICSYDWDFGGVGSIIGGNGSDRVVYQYDLIGDYDVTLTMIESTTGKKETDTITVKAIEVEPPPPTGDFSTTVNGTTVTLTAILPADVVRAYVYWGDRKQTTYTDPANDIMEHTYIQGGTSYKIRVQTIDAGWNTVYYTFNEDPDLDVTIP